MNYKLGIAAALTVSLCGCATDARYGLYRGGTLGAATGAIIGAVSGQGMGTGAVAGAVVGGALGAAVASQNGEQDDGVVVNGIRFYRDTQGYCYYVDPAGKPIYDASVRC
jgi:uncharacterized protein YcfJ